MGKPFMGTAHAAVGRPARHPKHEAFPHPAGIPKPACAGCHEEVAARYRLGIHGSLRAKGNAAAPGCAVCHGNVHGVKPTGAEAFRKRSRSSAGPVTPGSSATLAIVVWHFYTAIFDPDVYPMDPSWITGYTVRSGESEDARR